MGLLGSEQANQFVMGSDGVLKFGDKVCILGNAELNRLILEEGHKSRHNMHHSMIKIYHDLEEYFLWPCIKLDV